MAPDPCEDVTLTQTTAGIPVGTLAWTHPVPADVDRFMLFNYNAAEAAWSYLEPRPKAEYGAGPYEATVPIRTDVTWFVAAVNADEEYST